METVFVYGALRRGASNYWRMERGEFLGEGTVRGKLYAIDWYPGVVPDQHAGEVRGDLYRIDARLAAELDAFEGIGQGGEAGDEYERVRVPVRTAEGETEAWIYAYRRPADGHTLVPGGDWVASGLGGDGAR